MAQVVRLLVAACLSLMLTVGVSDAARSKFEQSDDCYRIAKYFRWGVVEPWVMDNTGELCGEWCDPAPFDDVYIESLFRHYFTQWEIFAGQEIVGGRVYVGTIDGADGYEADGVNEIHWSDEIAGPWQVVLHTRWSDPTQRGSNKAVITECDIVLNSDWPWGDGEVDGSKWDFEGTVAMLTGLYVGMDFVDSNTPETMMCAPMTMHRIQGPGQVERRELDWGDRLGVERLYE